MKSRFWVVGGDYTDCNFERIVPGSEQIHGPFANENRAHTEWKRLTFRDQLPATRRYSIATEGPR